MHYWSEPVLELAAETRIAFYDLRENQAAIDGYRTHPDHVRVATKLDAMEDHGIGVDFQTSSAN